MREILILILMGAIGYLAYDDYFKQRPALEQAQAAVRQLTAQRDQLRENPVRLIAPTTPTPPGWFQKHLDESSSSLDTARRHKQKNEDTNPQP